MAVESVVSATPACLACGAATRFAFTSVEKGFDLFACDACGSARTWPALDAASIGAWYPQVYYGTRNVRFNRLFERMTRWFRQRRARVVRKLIPGGKVLDVGCGRGLTLSFLRDAGFDAVGLEVSDVAAAHARDTLGLDVRTGDFLTTTFERESFAAIIFWHSLEHIAEPLRALDRAYELLAPGGVLIVAVPNFGSIQARVAGREWFHLDVPRRLLKLYSYREDLVGDLFLGRGTTALACVELVRRFHGGDRSPTYVQLAEHRVAIALDGEQTA